MRRLLLILLLSPVLFAQTTLSPAVKAFLKYNEQSFALEHVNVIDGTGAPAKADQTIVISGGKIVSVAPSREAQIPSGARRLNLTDHSVFPGIIGMHDHIFYPTPPPDGLPSWGDIGIYGEAATSFPPLYLAGGVTFVRTMGAVEPYTDIELKRAIDAGQVPGPKLDVTGPFIEGPGGYSIQMHSLRNADDARAMVNYWADQGATSMKAYMDITREELKAAVNAAHAHKIKLGAHVCALTFREAVDAGVDSIEHGISWSSDFVPDKKPDQCPGIMAINASLANLTVQDELVQSLIHYIADHKVALTSTLPVIESFTPGRPDPRRRVIEALSPQAQMEFYASREQLNRTKRGMASPHILRLSMDFEYAFVKAGGLLLAGTDPAGPGVVAGYANQREIELLVEAGFTPPEAIKIATYNGALFLDKLSSIGTIAPGKIADLVVVKGDPSKNINNVENVEIVFKDGRAYDPTKLQDSVKGMVGLQ
jgi:imidazolonepropionase-like amidohydrolase